MNTILWVLQSLLAAFFLMPGYLKITGSTQKHIDSGHLKPGNSVIPIRLLGVLELLGCGGIILPQLTKIMPILTPITSVCFCLVMASGLIVHAQKREYKMLPMLSIVLTIAAFVAWCRFQH